MYYGRALRVSWPHVALGWESFPPESNVENLGSGIICCARFVARTLIGFCGLKGGRREGVEWGEREKNKELIDLPHVCRQWPWLLREEIRGFLFF